jgi:hypothetical protein
MIPRLVETIARRARAVAHAGGGTSAPAATIAPPPPNDEIIFIE